MSLRVGTLVGILVVMVAGAAVAGPSVPSLVAGGTTIGGPGVSSILSGETVVIASGMDTDACVTVVNTDKRSAIDVQLFGNTTESQAVAGGNSFTLCVSNLDSVQVECLGLKSCSCQWRIDAN